MKIIAVVPAYNEAKRIGDLVNKLNHLVDMIIVADDNSNDNTVDIVERLGAYVVHNHGKRGFGANTKNGIDEALTRGFDIIVTLDGDGQHKPEEISRLIEPIEKNVADMVVG